MGRFKDLTGQRFGRLVAISHMAKNKRIFWLCQCDCGNRKEIDASNLSSGHTRSCGCLHIETAIKTNTSHGLSKTRFYQIWRDMIVRTTSSKSIAFDRYGGRGVVVEKRWQVFENFMSDMYEKYLEHVKKHGEKNTTIDRINNDGNYGPENCKWATNAEQCLNRRSNKRYYCNGEMLTPKEIAGKYGLTYSAVIHRIKRNWPVERLTEPLRGDNCGA